MQANALFPGSTIYAAQKAALQHAARILAKEFRGAVEHPRQRGQPRRHRRRNGPGQHRLRQVRPLPCRTASIPRFGRAEDVARAVRFFLEPDNYITGQVLCVDGGITL